MWVGYWASYSFWEMFSKAWWKILDRSPALPYWHQTDVRAANRPDPFDALTSRQLAGRERSLCKLISSNAHRMHPVVVRISNVDWKKHVKDKITFARRPSKAERGILRPELLARQHTIALTYAAKAIVELSPKEAESRMPVSLYCEARDGDPYQDQIVTIWKTIAKHENEIARSKGDCDIMGDLHFVLGKQRKAAPLEAADMLAWHLSRRAKQQETPDDRMWSAIGGEHVNPVDVTADELKRYVADWNRWVPTPFGR
jgi:hypothetical protein